MQTRILHTKIHFEDDWFNSMPHDYKYPFIYLITNSHIGLTGIYNLTQRVALLETKCPESVWVKAVAYFQESGKILIHKDWVLVVNAYKHSNYRGPQNQIAFQKELNSVPPDVINYFRDTVSIPYIYPIDTTINHKSKTINHKPKTLSNTEIEEINEAVPF